MAGKLHPKFLVGFLVINILIGIAAGILQLAVPLYALSLKATMVQLGLITGLGGIGRLIIILPSGLMVDRYGARSLFYCSTALSALFVLLLITVKSPFYLILVLVFQGMAQAVCFMTLNASFLKRMPSLDISKAGWQRGATSIGFLLLGPIIGGYLVQGKEFIRTFSVISILMLSSIGLSYYRKVKGITEDNRVNINLSNNHKHQIYQFKEMLFNPILIKVMLIEGLGAASFAIFVTFMVPVATEILGIPVKLASWLIVIQGIASMLINICGGGLLSKFTLSRLFVSCNLLIVLGAGFLAIGTSVIIVFFGTAVFGLGLGLLNLLAFTKLNLVEGEKGKIAALYSFSVGLGSTIGPIAAGYIGNSFSLQGVFWTPVLLFSICLVYFIGLKKIQSIKQIETLDQG